jgi:hypothetical protein
MPKFILMILGLNVVVFLLGLVCSAVGMMGYLTVQGQPAFSSVSAAFAAAPPAAATQATPVPTATVKASPTAHPTSEPDSDSKVEANRIEYYRGIFDICVASGKNTNHSTEQVLKACQEVVRRAMDQKWFETPSKGWKWPIPASFSSFSQNG